LDLRKQENEGLSSPQNWKTIYQASLGRRELIQKLFVSVSRAVQYHCRMLSCNKSFRFQFGYVSSNSKKKEIFNRMVQNLLNHFVQSLETKCALLIYSELNELHTTITYAFRNLKLQGAGPDHMSSRRQRNCHVDRNKLLRVQ
jgi:hypothetical protein